MLDVANVIGKQDDWANYITNVEMRDQPLLDWLPVGDKPVNPEHKFQMDKYADPVDNSHVDGEPWQNFDSGAENRGKAYAYVQWLDKGVSISRLSQDVTNDAAIADQMAYEIPKKLKEMRQDWEVALCEDAESREDDKINGYKTRSIGKWISSTAQTHQPVPTAFLTPAASIDATAIASQTENGVRDVCESMYGQCKNNEPVTVFCGQTTKRKFADFQFYIPSSTSTQATGVVFNQQTKDRTVTRRIDSYDGDYFDMDLVLTPWLVNLTGSATAKKGRAYFLHQSRWLMRWSSKPKVYKPEFKGGSYEAAMDMIAMLVCKNPLGEGKLAPT